MARRTRARQHSAQYAWLITGPLALFATVCFVTFWDHNPGWYKFWLAGLVGLVGICLAYVSVFNIVIRRSTYSMILTEVPFVLMLYFLPPPMVILIVVVASVGTQMVRSTVITPVKMWFNVAKQSAAISAALLLIAAIPHTHDADPATWGVLTA